MKSRSIVLTDEAVDDIDRAVAFYNRQVEGLGQYFCCSAKRFPSLIYYSSDDTVVTIVAVLDTRRNPDRTNKRLS